MKVEPFPSPALLFTKFGIVFHGRFKVSSAFALSAFAFHSRNMSKSRSSRRLPRTDFEAGNGVRARAWNAV